MLQKYISVAILSHEMTHSHAHMSLPHIWSQVHSYTGPPAKIVRQLYTYMREGTLLPSVVDEALYFEATQAERPYVGVRVI